MFSSCEQKHFYNEYKTVDVKSWKSTDTLNFDVEIPDSTSVFNVALSVRHQKTYEFSNLWLNVITGFGNETRSRRLEVPLFKNDGKPYGKSSGSLCTQTIPFEKEIRFPAKGKYRISLIQLMRKDPLDGISDVGIIMDKK